MYKFFIYLEVSILQFSAIVFQSGGKERNFLVNNTSWRLGKVDEFEMRTVFLWDHTSDWTWTGQKYQVLSCQKPV